MSVRARAHYHRPYAWAELQQPRDLGSPSGDELPIREVIVAVGEGRFPDPTFEVTHGSRFGDLLWTTGKIKVASDRFLAVLEGAGASGYTTFDLRLTHHGDEIPGYRGLVTTGHPDTDDVWGVSRITQSWWICLTDDLLVRLTAAGVGDFLREPIES